MLYGRTQESALSLVNHLRAVADAFFPERTHRQHTAFGESRKYTSKHNQNALNDENRAHPLNSF